MGVLEYLGWGTPPLVYDFALSQWIGACLLRDSFDVVVQRIRQGRSLDDVMNGVMNQDYLNRMIKEESARQFSETYRPIVELILNAVDAKPPNVSDYEVIAKVKTRSTSIRDRGSSMGLEDILKYLIIPFSTEKKGIVSGCRGEFGLGFFSALGFCTLAPRLSEVVIRAVKGDEAHCVRFYATAKETSSIRMALHRVRSRRQGTSVIINNAFHVESLERYIADRIRDIPTVHARIYLNGNLLNPGSGVPWYEHSFWFAGKQLDLFVQQDVPHAINLSSMGVLVKQSKAPSLDIRPQRIGVKVLFPPAVHVVIGRDDFKRDAVYFEACRHLFYPLEKLIRDHQRESIHNFESAARRFSVKVDPDAYLRELNTYLVELIPAVFSAVGLRDPVEIPNLEAFKQALGINAKTYVFLPETYASWQPLLSPEHQRDIFTALPQGYGFWGKVFQPQDRFFRDHVQCIIDVPYSEIQKDPLRLDTPKLGALPNIKLLLRGIAGVFDHDPKIRRFRVVSMKPGAAALSYAVPEKTLLVNAAHAHADGACDLAKLMSLYSSYLRLSHIKEQQVETPSYVQDALLRLNHVVGGFA